MHSRKIVSLAFFALIALALPLIISRHLSEADIPATKVPKLKRLASDNLVKASPSQSTQPLSSLQGNQARDYLKEHGLYVRLQNLIEAAEYQIDQQPHAHTSSALRPDLGKNNAAEIYEATNPAQKLIARFNGRDVVLQPLTNKRTTTLQARLRLESYGYGRRMMTAGAGTMRVDGNRIEIRRRPPTRSDNNDQADSDEIVEWYQNRKDGLEQGFTLAAPPGKRHERTPLRVRLTVTGRVRPALVDSGKALELIGGNGRWLRYDHLMATDASGRQLQTRFGADRNQISLLIDDTQAVYPIQIDPLFTQIKKLTASDAAADDRFGYSVATNGDTVVVGAYGKGWQPGTPPTSRGAVYIFERHQGGAENWGQVKILTPSDAAANDRFGWSVAIDGDTVVVGALVKDSNTGAAYIFKRNQGGAENWGQVKKLTAGDAAGGALFGSSVSINADTLVVGASGSVPSPEFLSTGAAYVFKRNQGGAENWGQVKKLTASDGVANHAFFGYSASIHADTVVVGAHGRTPGRAYVFERNQGGAENWGPVKVLTASDAVGGDQFGISVAINNDTLAVGAIHGNRATSGAVYMFERNQGGAENWGEVKKLTASDPGWGYFGYSVSIDADTIVVGAYGKIPGAAYIFERNRGGVENWGQVQRLTASDGAGYGDQFGISVAIDGDTLAVGATHGNRATSGAVYIFERNQGGVESWGQVQELTASDANLLDEFGISVAIDGDTMVVGAWAINLSTGGAAYIFERNLNGVQGWVEVQKLTSSDVATHDQFGSSVGIDGNTAFVGAEGKNSHTGAAYAFALTSTPTPSPTPPNVSCSFTANLGSPPAPATTGTMTTRLFRSTENQGTCGTNSFPGNTGSGAFPFDAYSFTNPSSSPVCVSAALTINSQSNANYQIAAFLAPFVATDITNASRYLGDPSISSGAPSPLIQSFQFTVPGNTSFAIVVFSVNGTAELGGSYTFQVMSLSSFCPAPTPAATPPATKGTAVAYQIDAAHTGAQFDSVIPPLTQRWSRDLGGQISYPLIVGGRIFVTVANQSSNGTKLYALDETNGATLWGPIDLGGSFGWSNAAYDSGRVFAVNADGLLRAFDAASGTLLWSKQLPGQHSFNSPPTASGGVVYVVGAGTGTTLYAVDEQDGTLIWANLLFSGNDSSPAVTSTGVYVAFSCNEVYDFSPQDGSLIWHHLEGCTGGGGSTPVLFGGRLFVGDSLTEKRMFHAPTGAVLGTFPPGPPPAFSGSTGYFLTGSILRARDAHSGAVRWSFTGDGTLISAPIVVNGHVYIGSSSGKVYALDGNTGANLWTGNLGAAVQSTESPVTRPHTGLGAGDGLVVVPASTRLVAYHGPLQLILDESGPASNQVAALDSVLFTRDPFPVVNAANMLNLGVDRNTRVVVFAMNLSVAAGSVTVGLVDSNNQSFNIAAEDVRPLPNSPFTQVIFRLPDHASVGTCIITLQAHGQTSNSGSIRIRT